MLSALKFRTLIKKFVSIVFIEHTFKNKLNQKPPYKAWSPLAILLIHALKSRNGSYYIIDIQGV